MAHSRTALAAVEEAAQPTGQVQRCDPPETALPVCIEHMQCPQRMSSVPAWSISQRMAKVANAGVSGQSWKHGNIITSIGLYLQLKAHAFASTPKGTSGYGYQSRQSSTALTMEYVQMACGLVHHQNDSHHKHGTDQTHLRFPST